MLNRTHIFYRHTTNRPSSTVFSFHVRVCVIFQLCCQVLFPQFYWLCDEGLLIVSSTNLHTAQWKEQQAERRGCGGAVDAGTSLLCQIEWKERGEKKHILLTHSHVVFIYSSWASNLGISGCFLRQVKCLKSCVVICLDGMHMCVIFKRSEWVRILERTISQVSFSFSSFYLFPCGLKGNKHGWNNNRTSLCSLNLCLWHSPFQHSLFTRKPEHFHPNLSALQLCSFSV